MAGIIALGIIIRIAYLIRPRSFWGDEWFTIFTSQQNIKDAVITSLKDVHPPLQFILFHFDGYRLWPFVAGVLSLYFFSKLSKDRLATFLFAISPYFIHLSGETRGYGFLCLFSILALIGYRWAFPIALLSEHYAWFLLLVVPFSLWFIPFLAASLGLIIYQSGTEQVFSPNRGFELSFAFVIKKIVGLFIQFGGGIKYSFLTVKQAASLIKNFYLVFFIAPVIFLFYAKNKRYLKLFLIPLVFLLIFYPIRLNARYLPFCGLSYLILIAMGFRQMSLKHKVIARVIIVFFIIANVISLAWLFSVNHDPYHREDYIGASQYLKDKIKPSDGLIGSSRQVEFYLKQKFPKDGETIWEVFLGNPDMAINQRVWASKEKELGRTIVFTKKFGDLVWVIKYAK